MALGRIVFVALAVSVALTTSVWGTDRVDNPPGPRGGPGTNWENPPGPIGGRGASPDVRACP